MEWNTFNYVREKNNLGEATPSNNNENGTP